MKITEIITETGTYDSEGLPNGIFLSMPEKQYHSYPFLSQSGLKEFAKSPAHYRAYLKREWKVDEDREIYRAVHLLALEEPDAANRIVLRPGVWRASLKEEVQSLQAQGYVVLKDLELPTAIAASVKEHETARELLSNALCEVSVFWKEGDIRCKARIDILSLFYGELALADLKNFGSLHDEGLIALQVAKQGYVDQLAWYERAFLEEIGRKLFIFVEDKAPHGVKVREAPDEPFFTAYEEQQKLLETFRSCQKLDVWPSYPPGIEQIVPVSLKGKKASYLQENENEAD